MNQTAVLEDPSTRQPPRRPLADRLRVGLAAGFALMFLLVSVVLLGLAADRLYALLVESRDPVETLIKAINFAVVGIAIFELAAGIHQEYLGESQQGNLFALLRRSVARFVSVVCIALSLEGLMMAIKYSQLDLAGNLYYPVAIIFSAAALLLALGGFLKLTEAAAADPQPL